MADSAELDVIMKGVDNGVADMTDNASAALQDYNAELADLARKDAANARAKQLREDFEQLTDAQKQAIVAADDERRALDELAQQAASVEAAQNAAGESAGGLNFSMSELNQGIEIVNKALGYAKQAYAETIGVSQQYAEQVRDLKAITGESTQATSDLIQVADDFQISADDLTASMRVMTKNGLVPNKETIIGLAKEYQAIQDPLAKNEFLVKNLGRASSNYTNFLSQNTDELSANFDAQAKQLAFGEKEAKQAEQLRLAQDQLNDTLEHLKLTVGTELTPAFSAWVQVLNKATTSGENFFLLAGDLANASVGNIVPLMRDYNRALEENKAQLEGTTEAQTTLAGAIPLTTEELQAQKDAAAALSAEYTNILQNSIAIQGAYDTFGTSTKALADEQNNLRQQIADTPVWDTEKIASYQAKLDEIPAKADEVAAKYHEALSKMAYDNLIAKLSADGLTDAEFEQAQRAGEALGIFSKGSADQAIALNSLTTALATGKITLADFQKAVEDGSFTVDSSNKRTIEGYDTLSRTVKEKAGDAGVDTASMATKAVEAKDSTTAALSESGQAWDGLATNVTENVATLKGQIQDYIAALNQIPSVINTQLNVTGNTQDALVS